MGKLVQVATNTVTSPVASVTLTGINTDDVYMLAYNDWRTDTDSIQCRLRVTKSGTPDVTGNFDLAIKQLEASLPFFNYYYQNDTFMALTNIGTGTSESHNGIYYFYNFNSSSEYSFISIENIFINPDPKTAGFSGGAVHTVASASDGIQLFQSAGNISGGTFTLYKVL